MTIDELAEVLQELKNAGCSGDMLVYVVISDRGALPVKSVYTNDTLGFIIDGYPEVSSQR